MFLLFNYFYICIGVEYYAFVGIGYRNRVAEFYYIEVGGIGIPEVSIYGRITRNGNLQSPVCVGRDVNSRTDHNIGIKSLCGAAEGNFL